MSELALPREAADEHARGARLLGDELLARLVGRGSDRAFSILYERHHQALYRYCRSILRDEHDAQDALQSTMTRAYVALSDREREVNLRAWLFRIAHNESITILRKHGRELDLDRSSVQARAGGEPHEVLESRGRLRQLVCDLQELPERQRSALVMRELSGLRIEEIALALAISPAAAKQALFEARSSLHDLAQGREMDCEEVCLAISAHDRRVLRGRRIRAHLRDCESCRGFQLAIDAREADLRALAPVLPASAATAILARLLGAGHWGAGAGGGGAAVASGSSPSLLAHASGSLLLKGATGAAIVAATAVGTVRLASTYAPSGGVRNAPLRVLDSSSTSRGDLGAGARALWRTGGRDTVAPGPVTSSAGVRTGGGAASTQVLGAAPRFQQLAELNAHTEQSARGQAHRIGEKPAHGRSAPGAHGHVHVHVRVHAHGGRPGSAVSKGHSHGSTHGRAGKPATPHSTGKDGAATKKDTPVTPKKREAREHRPSSQAEGGGGQTYGSNSSPGEPAARGRPGYK